jgi:(p)ppGpp synthase/HD superfamily hydrolase
MERVFARKKILGNPQIKRKNKMCMSSRAKKAIDFALNNHLHQIDKAGRPYFGHVIRVALTVQPLGEDYFITGLLHDTIEDCGVTKEDIAALWGDVVAEAVDSVSRRKDESYMELIERASKNKIGVRVKLADLADNSDPERISVLPEAERSIVNRYNKARLVLEGIE